MNSCVLRHPALSNLTEYAWLFFSVKAIHLTLYCIEVKECAILIYISPNTVSQKFAIQDLHI